MLKPLVGKKIVSIRPFVPEELDDFDWTGEDEHYAVVISFDDGTQLVPMRDPEGNGAGFLEVLASE
jgi:hypothetical protein